MTMNKPAHPIAPLLLLGWLLALLLGAPVAPAGADEDVKLEQRQHKEASNLESLVAKIDELEKMENYYSQLSRPRFGRSDPSLRSAWRLMGAPSATRELSGDSNRASPPLAGYPSGARNYFDYKLTQALAQQLQRFNPNYPSAQAPSYRLVHQVY